MNRAPSVSVARVNGIELAYQVFGAGSPLVLLHGGFGSVEMFGPNVAALAAGHRVIGVDLQSHGRSPVANRPMRFEAMADDIAALIAQLELERAAVMGFSMGGPWRCEPRSSIRSSWSGSCWSRPSSSGAAGIPR
jgi:pimeloyl-ACP methyl ester carboxylesterase